ATQALQGQVAKATLDQLETRAGSGGKGQVKARMAAQPTLNAWMLVGGVLIHDQVQVQSAGRLLVDPLQEASEFLMPMLRHAIPDDRAIERREGGEQRGGAVARAEIPLGSRIRRDRRTFQPCRARGDFLER